MKAVLLINSHLSCIFGTGNKHFLSNLLFRILSPFTGEIRRYLLRFCIESSLFSLIEPVYITFFKINNVN